MTLIIGCVSQKGGVGKSTIARMLAREFAQAGWSVLIADTDNRQTTSTKWVAARNSAGIMPEIAAMPVGKASQVPQQNYDCVIFDGAPNSSKLTLEIVRRSHFTVIPTGASIDDLEPSVLLGHELRRQGIKPQQFAFALCRVSTEAEIVEARQYITMAGYRCLEGELLERPAYRVVQNGGRATTETPYGSLNRRAEVLAQAVIDLAVKEET